MQPSFQKERNAKLRDIFADETSFASVLVLAALSHYGNEILGLDGEPAWSPETILHEIEDDFNIKMPQGCFDRLMAGLVIITTDMFYEDLPTFIHICNVLAGSPVTEEFDPANVLEISWALTESNLLHLDPGENPEFSPDIQAYVLEACREEGIMSPPVILGKIIGQGMNMIAASSFTDQPELFQSVWYNQQSHAIENQLVIQSNIWKLYQQMRNLVNSDEVQKKLTELQQEASASIQELRKQKESLVAS